jgi:uncharacterized membrane protein YtjA (UPF0391 family)
MAFGQAGARPGTFSPVDEFIRVQETPMLKWALIFLVIALIAGLLGFTGIAGTSMAIAKTLFFIFLVIFLVLLLAGLFLGGTLAG